MARKFSLHASWETPLSNTTVLVQIARGHSREDPRGDAPRLQPRPPSGVRRLCISAHSGLCRPPAKHPAPCFVSILRPRNITNHQSLSIDTRFTNKTDSRHDTCVGVRATGYPHACGHGFTTRWRAGSTRGRPPRRRARACPPARGRRARASPRRRRPRG